MRRTLLAAALILLGSHVAAAQPKPPDDPFDMSSTQKRITELGLPTVEGVAALEKDAGELFSRQECAKAVAALDRFARQANWLANLISAGLQPFYSASYDARKNFSQVSQLAPYETLANKYKEKRDRAVVMEAECLLQLGQKERGVGMLFKSLELISMSDSVWWARARKDLYDVIGVK